MAMRWYVLHVYSGSEKKVSETIREQAIKKGLEDRFEEVIVPTEKVVDIVKGQKKEIERKFFPGYVLIKMDLSDETWHLVKNTPRVSGFLGGKKPVPMTEGEAKRIVEQLQEGFTSPKSNVSYETGEEVRVVDGPFASFNGTVEEVDEEKNRLKVMVMIFGRSTPVELEFTQVEKL